MWASLLRSALLWWARWTCSRIAVRRLRWSWRSWWSARHVIPLLLLLLLWRWARRSPARHMASCCSWLAAHTRRAAIMSVRVVVAHHHVGIVVATVLGLHRMPGIRIRIILRRHAIASHVRWGRTWWATVHTLLLLLVVRRHSSMRWHIIATATVARHHRRMLWMLLWPVDSSATTRGRSRCLVLVPAHAHGRWPLLLLAVVLLLQLVVHGRLGMMLRMMWRWP